MAVKLCHKTKSGNTAEHIEHSFINSTKCSPRAMNHIKTPGVRIGEGVKPEGHQCAPGALRF